MPRFKLISGLRSYYRGCRGRDLAEFYDLESSLPYYDQVSRILCAHKRRILLRWLRERDVSGHVFELGGGIGTFARQLGRSGYRVITIDVSSAKTAKARRLTSRKFASDPGAIQHLIGDLRELGEGGEVDRAVQSAAGCSGPPRFEVILAADVLEHVPDEPAETMTRVRQLLAPGGCLLASVPSRLCINDPGHIWKLLPEDWEDVFRETGYDIAHRKMSRICWFGLPTPLPLAMVYELRINEEGSSSPQSN